MSELTADEWFERKYIELCVDHDDRYHMVENPDGTRSIINNETGCVCVTGDVMDCGEKRNQAILAATAHALVDELEANPEFKSAYTMKYPHINQFLPCDLQLRLLEHINGKSV